MSSSRPPNSSSPGPDSRPGSQQPPPARPPASPWSSGGLPIIPLTIAAVVAGALLIALLVLLGGGQKAPDGVGLASASAPVATASSEPTGSPGVATASASPSVSGGPAASSLPIEKPAHPTPTDLAFGRSLGSPTAPVQLEIWEDFQCPACDAFTGSMEPYLIDTYLRPGTARLTFHDIATIGNESLGAAISARCADRQGRFWPYHDLLFANQAPENSGVLTKDRSKEFAQLLGLDMVAFSTCLEDRDIEAAVVAETQEGLASGITVTPTLKVNGVIVSSATSSAAVTAAIAAALTNTPASPAP